MRRLAAPLFVACAAVGLAACGGGDSNGNLATAEQNSAPAAKEVRTTRVEVIKGLGGKNTFDPGALYRELSPGVVTILSLFGGGAATTPGGGDRGEGGQGSGFLIDPQGHIATNAHVVTDGTGGSSKRAQAVYVEFSDGNRVEAKIVGTDLNADVALLKIDPAGLHITPLSLGRSATLRVGQPVAAIGSPFGERQSLSVGVVSAVDRNIESLTAFGIGGAIQTDAAINPGNSGGPLLDAKGRVIGINSQIKSRSGGGEGVGFAVPVDVVKRSLGALREGGEAKYAYLGVGSVPLFPQLVERFDLPVDKGAWVQDVEPGTPADRAGIRGGRGETRFQIQSYAQGGDIITKIEGKPIQDANDLSAVVAQFQPGQEVTVEVHRGGETKDIKVTLGRRPLSASTSASGG
jgi:S1-C subfamily serine protease